jgi:uncharacterized protein (DUF1499 family)
MLSRLLLSLALLVMMVLSGPAPALASLLHLEGPEPLDLGVQAGGLSPCASPAHCARAEWSVTDPDAAFDQLTGFLQNQETIRIVERSSTYLHATATSQLFGFVDDLELFADPSSGHLQARSVSRLGDSDLGVNGQRLEMLRARLTD